MVLQMKIILNASRRLMRIWRLENKPGNSLSLHRTETTARAVARAKAEAHPGKKVLLLAVTEVETCLVTIQTKAVKSWE